MQSLGNGRRRYAGRTGCRAARRRWSWGWFCAKAPRTRGYGGAGRAWWEREPLAGAPTDRGAGPLPTRSASTPESWAKFTQENLNCAERERLASVNLRELIDCILRDTAEDLRLQCDAVNLAFGRRCEELEDARHKLGHHLEKVGSGSQKLRPGHIQATLSPVLGSGNP